MEVTMAEPGEILPERNVDMAALYDMLRRGKSSAEEIVAKMLDIKREAHPKSQLREHVTQILLNFVTLRQANRSILIEEDRVKAETERAKAPVDLTTLQLHNLMYEKNHYVKAIKACKDFKTKYTDIELVPEEEFFTGAPEEIKSSVLSTDTAHDLMMKRLNYELFQRKELCKLREKLEVQKKSLQGTITNRKKFLSSLPSHLKALRKASLPVQNQLGVLHTKKLKQHQLAELLAPPLYVIYSQLLAQKEAFGENIELEITGSIKDAQVFARQLANKDNVTSTNSENSKLDDDVPDEEDDGQRRRKRPKKVPSKENIDQSGIYQSHPLKVILHIDDDEASDLNTSKLITLKFEFLIKLNVACVGVEGSEELPESNILCNLFPDDTGLELPQQSAKLCVGNSLSFDERRTSRPYKWAQHLAGIDFLPEVSPLVSVSGESNSETTKHASILSGLSIYRQQNRVQTVIQRVRARRKAQLALAELIDSLRNLKWPTVTCESVPWTSHAPRSKLHGWLYMSSALNSTAHLPVAELERGQASANSDTDRKIGVSKEEMETTKEDGELPSLISAATGVNDVKLTSTQGSELEHTPRRTSLISKSIISPITKGKSPSFRRQEDDIDLMFESESEIDEPVTVGETSDNTSPFGGLAVIDNSWSDCGTQEYCLVLIRKLDNDERNMKLEAKIKISMEYPLRPPHFSLSLYSSLKGEDYSEAACSEFLNELCAMEAEVNVHLIRMLPLNQERAVLGHQVLCLAMLFDFFLDDGDLCSERRSNSVIDIGLCKPVSGGLVSRSFRGRDRRKMISWKENICTSGYPY
ncbi:PREDICTED: THO complex subunit 5A isoform X1 [Erythranthe guttata]|nr:PREDICTED: THO complex subunit 5A isoform X1 [Erythranthe guttata]|eukprot:XP_012838725.1 PREDICTED: THO complex subunit 5A isoform X1 [Erythranthe guttata]